ncbi:MAG TPA: hypothetical protein VI932_07655 [Bacteroidota bacterium]|nr:hypothetical protein [Bacteroidota bacterium]
MKRTARTTSLRNLPAMIFFSCVMIIGWGICSPVIAQTQFNADADHSIDLQTAVLYTTSFQQVDGSAVLKAEAFGKEAILALLSQPGCAGMRIYYGTGQDGQRVLVLVGVDVEGKDLYLGVLDDRGFPCPPLCDETSPLNGK